MVSHWELDLLLVWTSLLLHKLNPCPSSQSTTSWVLARVDSLSIKLSQLLWCRFQSPVMMVGVPGCRVVLASRSVVYPCSSPSSTWLYKFMSLVGGCLVPSHLTSRIMKSRSILISVLRVISIPAWSL